MIIGKSIHRYFLTELAVQLLDVASNGFEVQKGYKN